MRRPFLVAESIAARRRLFQVFGVSWSATRYAWLSPVSWFALGLSMALASRAQTSLASALVAGAGYGAVLYAANVVHSLGHAAAGHVAGAPVETVVLTSTRDVIVYSQPGAAAPPRRRLVRALGGPVANLALGCALMLVGHLTETPGIRMAGVVNIAVSLWALMPLPSLDGSVIWSMLRRGPRQSGPS